MIIRYSKYDEKFEPLTIWGLWIIDMDNVVFNYLLRSMNLLWRWTVQNNAKKKHYSFPMIFHIFIHSSYVNYLCLWWHSKIYVFNTSAIPTAFPWLLIHGRRSKKSISLHSFPSSFLFSSSTSLFVTMEEKSSFSSIAGYAFFSFLS